MTDGFQIYDDIDATLRDAMTAGPDNIAPDKAGGRNADFEPRLEGHAVDLEAANLPGTEEVRRAAALIRDIRATHEAHEVTGSAMAELGEIRMHLLGIRDGLAGE